VRLILRGTSIEGDKGLVLTMTFLMNRLNTEFFTGTAFSQYIGALQEATL
jgi:hypothetical protein